MGAFPSGGAAAAAGKLSAPQNIDGVEFDGSAAIVHYYGVTKLSSSVSSTSTALAATPSAVKQAYDLANGRVPSTRTVNGKELGADITLELNDIVAKNAGAHNAIFRGKGQLPLFAQAPEFIAVRSRPYWLRDVINATSFAVVLNYGLTNYDNAPVSNGVRPFFCIS